MLGKLATIADEDCTGDGLEQHAVRVRQTVAANQEDSARTILPRAPRPAVDQRREMLLHLVEIADRMLVQNDDVGLQALKAPILLRLQHLAHERQVIVLDDLDEQDRQIAGHAMTPQVLLAATVPRQRRRVGSQRFIQIEHT